ncbi:MAG: MYG1 family protein [Chlamydiia bacterium]|nr:MYG1 family protein [Chlamydiia bacterium]
MVLRSVGVHSGRFHADEVFAVSLLLFCNLVDSDKIYRTRDREVLDKCEFVCDVGHVFDEDLKRFDHHQLSYKGKRSSAGLVLDFLENKQYISSDLANHIRGSFLDGVDAEDTGYSKLPAGFASISIVLGSFYFKKHDSSDKNIYNQFMDAVDFAKGFLDRIALKYEYTMQYALPRLERACSECKNHTIILEEEFDWRNALFRIMRESKYKDIGIYFVISKDKKNHWSIKCVPRTLGSFECCVNFPESWAGLDGEELSRVSGIEGAVFCHKKLFISVWESKESALDAVKASLKGE